jgi:hypothetical protein
MIRIIAALFLSVLFYPLYFLVGEAVVNSLGRAGFLVTFLLMATYFCNCQFQLSRGGGLPKGWPIMLALNVVPLLMVTGVVPIEEWPVILIQRLEILLAGCGGAFAGEVRASRIVRKQKGEH